MKNAVGIFFFVIFAANLAFAGDLCRFYSHESRRLGCGGDSYLMRMYSYCQEFKKLDGSFSFEGREVLNKIRPCLVSSLKKIPQLTCSNVERASQRSHFNCYIKSGFCGLSNYEKFLIFEVVWQDVFNPGFFASMQRMIAACDRVSPRQ